MRDEPRDTTPTSGSNLSSLRVAIVHYYLLDRCGGELVVEALCDIFPQADLFALIARPESMSPILRSRRLTTSFLQKIPLAQRFYRHLLMLQPLALEQFDLRGYDLVISSESAPAKGVLTSPGTLHVCYCHSPMRYIWDMYPEYIGTMPPLVRTLFAITSHYVRMWDYASAARVDSFICNSHYVASRVHKFYRRESEVIYPPVQVRAVQIDDAPEDYYLAAGRLVHYKRFDLAIEACNRLGRKLKIVGTGPEYKRLKRLSGRNIEFLGYVSDAEKHLLFGKCRALLFAGEEDFGIVPVEVQAHGRPVIAFGSGGALETVRGLASNSPGAVAPTGVFFLDQSVPALVDAIERFEASAEPFDPEMTRQYALRFDASVFRNKMVKFLERKICEKEAACYSFLGSDCDYELHSVDAKGGAYDPSN